MCQPPPFLCNFINFVGILLFVLTLQMMHGYFSDQKKSWSVPLMRRSTITNWTSIFCAWISKDCYDEDRVGFLHQCCQDAICNCSSLRTFDCILVSLRNSYANANDTYNAIFYWNVNEYALGYRHRNRYHGGFYHHLPWSIF